MQNATQHNIKTTENLANMKHKIIVLSGKGGVGKSTIAAHLALALAKKNFNVGLLDSDIHGPSIPKILGIEHKKPKISEQGITPVNALPHLKVMSMSFFLPHADSPIIWRGPMKMGAIKQFLNDVHWGELDYLIVDLPPGTGDEPLSITQMIPDCDGAVIVTTPQDVATVSVRKSVNFVRKMNIPILGIVENMSGFTCPHCKKTLNIFKTGGGRQAAQDFKIPLLGTIPLDQSIVDHGDGGNLSLHYDNPKVNISFEGIVKNIEHIVMKKKR